MDVAQRIGKWTPSLAVVKWM